MEKKLTFEERFDNLMEAFEKSHKEWVEMREKSEKEWVEMREKSEKEWQAIKESQKETDRKIKETNRTVFGISTSNGMIAEEMIYESLSKDMTFCGIKFDSIINKLQVRTEDLQPKTDIDVLMVNGDTIAIIETKYKVEKDDLTELVNDKIKLFRQYYPKYSNHKIVLGVGGMAFEDGVLQTATKKGIGIIKVIGDKVEYNTDKIKVY